MLLGEFIHELLKDESQKKTDNVAIYTKMKKHKGLLNVSDNHLEKIRTCSDIQKRAVDFKNKKTKQLYIETCQDRFCPLCQARKSIKEGIKIATLLTYGQQILNYQYLFITLTMLSCKSDDLKDKIRELNRGIDKLMRRKAYGEQVIPAYITKVEVNYNRVKDTYNPHIHMICAVKGSGYFRKNNEDYIRQEQLLKDWQEVMNNESITQVNIQAVRTDENITKSSLEMAKYQAKSKDYNCSEEVFNVFYKALKGAKGLRFNREFNELSKVYDNDKWGLFESYKPKEEQKQSEYTKKLILYYWFNIKEYSDQWEDLTEDEKRLLETEKEFKGYDHFNNELQKWILTLDKETDKLNKLTDKLKNYENRKSEHSYYKKRIPIIEEQIKSQKRKIYKVNAKLSMYDYIYKNMRVEFKC